MDGIVEQILAEITACLRQVSDASLNQASARIETAQRIFLAGAGRSGLCMQALSIRLMHLGKTAYIVGVATTPSIQAGDLLILGSGSGQTSTLLAIAQKAVSQGAKILLFTTDEASPLARLADHRVVIQAPSLMTSPGESGFASVQPMGTLFEQSLLILCDSISLRLMAQLGVSAAQMQDRHANLE